jgi:hypothetical protein
LKGGEEPPLTLSESKGGLKAEAARKLPKRGILRNADKAKKEL